VVVQLQNLVVANANDLVPANKHCPTRHKEFRIARLGCDTLRGLVEDEHELRVGI
jgi:hypothetical protein